MPETLPIILAIIAAAPGLIALIQQRRKNNADVATVYESMAARSAEKLDKMIARIENLEITVRAQECELDELRSGVVLLIAQLKANGIEPVWKPKEKKAKS